MTKTLIFDLHFYKNAIEAKTRSGEEFLRRYPYSPRGAVYQYAVEDGLHCSFETAEIKNTLIERKNI